jgi:hypothetical protein
MASVRVVMGVGNDSRNEEPGARSQQPETRLSPGCWMLDAGSEEGKGYNGGADREEIERR